MSDERLVQIQICGDQHLIFDVKDVQHLREKHHIVGSMIGSLPRFPQQNGFYGLPMLLFPEVAALIIREGLGSWNKKDDSQPFMDELKYQVYRHLWQLGMYMTSGIKFGGDYLAYPGDPMRFHSHYVVRAQERTQEWTMTELVTMGRLAATTKKTFVLASVMEDEQVETFTIAWAGF
ncbi:tRNA-intron endonuclease catalytic domain-like protein [Hesseltinella vesiculosa]|uniref:tRNA-intron lyase n=1 Tax=Hesseltinella vesiculosa TaxID=101127 RepID=A0A1X2GCR4_9FUNG|nr:tRNA-intron endonuclease catalytic domain-like protein [Hesseltinella vesiculosa]